MKGYLTSVMIACVCMSVYGVFTNIKDSRLGGYIKYALSLFLALALLLPFKSISDMIPNYINSLFGRYDFSEQSAEKNDYALINGVKNMLNQKFGIAEKNIYVEIIYSENDKNTIEIILITLMSQKDFWLAGDIDKYCTALLGCETTVFCPG